MVWSRIHRVGDSAEQRPAARLVFAQTDLKKFKTLRWQVSTRVACHRSGTRASHGDSGSRRARASLRRVQAVHDRCYVRRPHSRARKKAQPSPRESDFGRMGRWELSALPSICERTASLLHSSHLPDVRVCLGAAGPTRRCPQERYGRIHDFGDGRRRQCLPVATEPSRRELYGLELL